jgi:lysophospholipase L1-like esterase
MILGGLCLLTGMAALSVSAAEPIRILPLGDSITQGGKESREEYTYRWPLFQLLVDGGYDFDFIGSMNKGLQPKATWPAEHKGKPFDMDHEGHYGWKTGKSRDNLREWMKKYPAPAEIALIHLGTNDQKATDTIKAVVEPLKDMIGALREANPNVVVLVGHLNFNAGAAPRIRQEVEAMIAETTSEQSPVIAVHHYKGWVEDPKKEGTDTFDWAHPNPQGQRKMAEAWFAAMKPYLEKMTAERKN